MSPSFEAPFSREHSLSISDREFNRFRELIYNLTGIHLSENKRMLVISRLTKRLHALGLQGFGQYLDFLKDAPEGENELVELINRITTNKTDFFREAHHFSYMGERLIPSLVARGQRSIRIWSAGCSTGEEPYTIAMVADTCCKRLGINPLRLDLKILATDIDTAVIERAKTAIYSRQSIAGVPHPYSNQYFALLDENRVVLREELRRMVTIRRFNLMHAFPFKRGFDLIFCRNVLIYFTQADRLSVVEKMRDCLRDGGILMLGHSESLLAERAGFRNLGDTIYAKA